MENLKAKSFDLRKDTVDIIVAGKGGHIGGDMNVIDIWMSLYFCQMNISPENMDDPNRDRFVLSKGHSVEAYYAVLAAKGFLDLEDIKAHFSKFGSKYIGHPNNKLPGIEMIGIIFKFPEIQRMLWDMTISMSVSVLSDGM